MRRTVPPSAEIEDQIDELLAVGVGENPRESLSGLAKLGARLIIQRAVVRHPQSSAAAVAVSTRIGPAVTAGPISRKASCWVSFVSCPH